MQVRRYRHRPHEVDAVQVTRENMLSIAVWLNGVVQDPDAHLPGPERGTTPGVVFRTLEGRISAPWGAWLLHHPGGRFSVIGSGFENAYEPVPDPDGGVA